MKVNHDKCHLLVSGKNNMTMDGSGFKIKNTECGKLLGINPLQCCFSIPPENIRKPKG